MKKHLSKLSFLVIGLSLAATASYLNAWSGPTSQIVNGIPNGNVDAPINIGLSDQVKQGNIEANALSAVGVVASQLCLGANCITDWSSAGGGSSVPTGTVAAFNLTTCPAGWILADGNSGTKDLRGSFIRGYGTSTAGTAASGAFGVFQNDDFKSHSHNEWYLVAGAGLDQGNYYNGSYGPTSATGGSETRPDNVALLFCQKDGTSSGGGSSVSDEFSSFKLENNISTFPNNIVCRNSANGNSIIFRIEDFWNHVTPKLVVYRGGPYLISYKQTNGQIQDDQSSGTCPTQLTLDGRLTQ